MNVTQIKLFFSFDPPDKLNFFQPAGDVSLLLEGDWGGELLASMMAQELNFDSTTGYNVGYSWDVEYDCRDCSYTFIANEPFYFSNYPEPQAQSKIKLPNSIFPTKRLRTLKNC